MRECCQNLVAESKLDYFGVKIADQMWVSLFEGLRESIAPFFSRLGYGHVTSA